MEIVVIIFIYIVGIFAAIALSSYLWTNELDDKEDLIAFFCLLSWIFVLAIIMGVMWIYVIKYPFVLFYNKCKERFKNKRNEKLYRFRTIKKVGRDTAT